MTPKGQLGEAEQCRWALLEDRTRRQVLCHLLVRF